MAFKFLKTQRKPGLTPDAVLERHLDFFKHRFNDIRGSNSLQHRSHGSQIATILHTPLILWLRDYDTVRVHLTRSQGYQRWRDIIKAMEGSEAFDEQAEVLGSSG